MKTGDGLEVQIIISVIFVIIIIICHQHHHIIHYQGLSSLTEQFMQGILSEPIITIVIVVLEEHDDHHDHDDHHVYYDHHDHDDEDDHQVEGQCSGGCLEGVLVGRQIVI